jgi:hypothetical protein
MYTIPCNWVYIHVNWTKDILVYSVQTYLREDQKSESVKSVQQMSFERKDLIDNAFKINYDTSESLITVSWSHVLSYKIVKVKLSLCLII